ncbi:MAG: FG-GAP repeat protein [Planctomycetes bacterium]|nr:FG-GAP repeat protein [Planctomycetota bacterium]
MEIAWQIRRTERRWPAVVVLLPCAASLEAQGTDLIEAGQIEGRGVAFEAPILRKFSSMDAAVGLGDVDGDGFHDVLLVVRTEPEGAPNPWAAVIVKGRASLDGRHTVPGGLDGIVVLRPSTPLQHPGVEAFGPSGDIDGDGLADVLLSLPYFPAPDGRRAGAGYLLFGDRALDGEHAFEEVGRELRGIVFTSSDPEHDWVGQSMAVIGDFDGDGRTDLAVGAPSSTNLHGEVLAGILFILLDAARLPAEVDLAEVGASLPGYRIHGNPEQVPPETAARVGYDTIGFFGHDVIRAGDFDGDGRSDILVTEPDPYPPPTYLILGRPALPPVLDIEGFEEIGTCRSSAAPPTAS